MALEALDNNRWGFDTHCFVCEPSNTSGLAVPFAFDRERNEVIGRFELDKRFSGAPNWAHGGVLTAIMDDAMVWSTIVIAQCFAATKEMNIRFRKPVPLGSVHVVRGRIVSDEEKTLRCSARIETEAGELCAETDAAFIPLGPITVAHATGATAGEAEAPFVRRQDA